VSIKAVDDKMITSYSMCCYYIIILVSVTCSHPFSYRRTRIRFVGTRTSMLLGVLLRTL